MRGLRTKDQDFNIKMIWLFRLGNYGYSEPSTEQCGIASGRDFLLTNTVLCETHIWKISTSVGIRGLTIPRSRYSAYCKAGRSIYSKELCVSWFPVLVLRSLLGNAATHEPPSRSEPDHPVVQASGRTCPLIMYSSCTPLAFTKLHERRSSDYTPYKETQMEPPPVQNLTLVIKNLCGVHTVWLSVSRPAMTCMKSL